MKTLLIKNTVLPTGENIIWGGEMPEHKVYAKDDQLLQAWKLHIAKELFLVETYNKIVDKPNNY
jgi:hypothetical protein